MALSVHFAYTPTDDSIAHLRERLEDDIKTTFGTDSPENANYHILISGRPSVELLDASPNLNTLLIPFAGVPAVTKERMADYPQIAIHNLHHNAPPTAEMALALLMAVARNLIPSDRDFRQHDWTPRYQPYPSVLLQGKTALILGYGAVGEHLGTILKAMGMRVLGTRRRYHDMENGIFPSEHMPNYLPKTDVLIVALPATDETHNLISTDELSALPKGAIVINIGRASVIDQYALYDALKSGHLHGAASDVWYHYPPDEASRTHTAPADVSFHELDNMVMSPHRAGAGGNHEIELLRMDAIAKFLNLAKQGEPLPHLVDLDLGY